MVRRAIRRLLSWLARSPVDATTVFGFTFWWRSQEQIAHEDGFEALSKLLLHEHYHAHRQRVDGLVYYPLYFWRLIRHGYWNHPEEVEARRVAGQE